MIKISSNWIFRIAILLIVFGLFLYPLSDADLGWHLKYGEYFLNNHQILKTNTFSYTLADYQWVNHSWMYDIVVALINQIGKFQLISIFGALLVGFSFVIILQPTFYSLLLLPIGWYLASPLLSTGLKSHYVSLLLFTLTIRIISSKQIKYLYFLPFIFLLWANFHGQFLFGFGIVLIYFIVNFFKNKKIPKRSAFILFISFIVTFINPC